MDLTISSQCPPDGCSIDHATHGAYEDLQVVGKQVAFWSLATYLFVFAHTASFEEQLIPEPTQRSSLFFDLRLYLEPLSQRDLCTYPSDFSNEYARTSRLMKALSCHPR